MDEILDILLSVHRLSEEIKESEKRCNEIPIKVDRLEKDIERASADLTQKKNRIQEIKKTYNLKEGDIKENEENSRKLNAQTPSVKTNEEYRALQKEIEYLHQTNQKTEEEMIVLLEEEEQIKGSFARIEQETKTIVDKKTVEIGELKKELGALQEKLDLTRHVFADTIKKLPEDIQTVYERVSKARGNAVCLIKDNICTGCYAQITHQVVNELQKRHKLIICDSCGRILIYKQ
jgi:predicted  nucleic acid-binding Zn-ribbon protein